MPIDLIEFQGARYPAFQAHGNAAQFVLPFARHLCRGVGVDVGCGRPEWALPGAVPVDPAFTPYHATRFPPEFGPGSLEFVFSSHCLEHVPDWVEALDYWCDALKPGGVLFLYLPHPDQEYWAPWNNRKHRHVLHPNDVENCLIALGIIKVFVSGRDLNHSYAAIGEKPFK